MWVGEAAQLINDDKERPRRLVDVKTGPIVVFTRTILSPGCLPPRVPSNYRAEAFAVKQCQRYH